MQKSSLGRDGRQLYCYDAALLGQMASGYNTMEQLFWEKWPHAGYNAVMERLFRERWARRLQHNCDGLHVSP